MAEQFKMKITFMDGVTINLEGTPPEGAELQRATRMKEFLNSGYLALEVENKLLFIPVHNVRSIMVDPSPSTGLPDIILKNLKFVNES